MAIKVNAKQAGSPGDPCCCGFVGACSTECRAKAAIPCLCGFAELTDPSTPPRIYRKRTLSGNMEQDDFESADCTADPGVSVSGAFSGNDFEGDGVYDGYLDCTLRLTAGGYTLTFNSATWHKSDGHNGTCSGFAGSGPSAFSLTPGQTSGILHAGTYAISLYFDLYGARVGFTTMPPFKIGARKFVTLDAWNVVDDYTPKLPACAITQSDTSVRTVDGAPAEFPNGFPPDAYGALVNQVALNQTTRAWGGTGACAQTSYSPVGSRHVNGTVSHVLSEEDTEDDALNRANAGLSWSPPAANCVATFAFRTDRAASACFGYRDVQVRAHVSGLTVGRNYEVHFSMYRRALGTMTPRSFLNEVVLHVTATAGTDVTGWVDVPNEGPGWDTICAGCFVKLQV